MSHMFYGATSFDQPLFAWDVRHVTDMSSMFSEAKSFNQPLSTWNVQQVTNMGCMLLRCGGVQPAVGPVGC